MRRQIHGPARLFALVAVFGLTSAALAQTKGLEGAPLKQRSEEIKKKIDSEFDSLQTLYKHLHSNPELSLQEVATAARLAKDLKSLDSDATEKVGGNGVVGVFKNGKGLTILVRTDMDALPV